VHALALGAGRIQERLEDAAAGVAKASGARHDMPADLGAKYESTVARLTAVAPSGDEGAFRATIKQMSEAEACVVASQILDLAYMAKAASEQEPVPPQRDDHRG
jgi:hypothetical protein